MPRLAAMEKAGYYPTPPEVAQIIATYLRASERGYARHPLDKQHRIAENLIAVAKHVARHLKPFPEGDGIVADDKVALLHRIAALLDTLRPQAATDPALGRMIDYYAGVVSRLQAAISAGQDGGKELVPWVEPCFPLGEIHLLDPCCGEGEALATLAQDGWRTWGNELHKGRAASAARRLDVVTCGPMEFLEVKGAAGAILFNPPYDVGDESTRRETEFLQLAVQWLAPGGLMICIVPRHVFIDPDFLHLFTFWHRDVVVRRFPDGLYEWFHQIVAFGIRRVEPDPYNDKEKDALRAVLDPDFVPAHVQRDADDLWYSFLHNLDPFIVNRNAFWSILSRVRQWAHLRPIVRDDLVSALRRSGSDIPLEDVLSEEGVSLLLSFANGMIPKIDKEIPPLRPDELEFSIPRTYLEGMHVSLPQIHDAVVESREHGVVSLPSWRRMFSDDTSTLDFRPLTPLRPGHAAMAVSAGMVDGMRMGNKVLRGATIKYSETTRRDVGDDGEGDPVVEEVERERLATVISLLDLETGDLEGYDSREDGFEEFLLAHAAELSRVVGKRYQPLYTGDDRPFARFLAQVRAPRSLPSWDGEWWVCRTCGRLVPEAEVAEHRERGHDVGNGLLPAQWDRAAALATGMRHHKSVLLVGEMGVGKTLTSLAAFAAYYGEALRHNPDRRTKIVVLCPKTVVNKWVREAEAALAAFGVRVHIGNRVSDVRQAMEEPGFSIIVLSKERAKLGAKWEPVVVTDQRVVTYEVVEQGYWGPVTKTVTKQMTVLLCPDCGRVLREGNGVPWARGDLRKRKRKCPHCGSPLWQEVPFKKGGRVALAEFIGQRYAGRYALIVDEAHMYKGADTDQAYAATDLIAGAQRVLAMTGTVYGGKASTIFHLLYRLSPEFRRQFAHNEASRFVRQFGLVETVRRLKKPRYWHGAYGYKRVQRERTREIPGASPGIVALLLPFTTFLTLEDLGVRLPPFHEYQMPVRIPGDDGHKGLHDGLTVLEHDLKEAAVAAFREEGTMGLLSSWLHASLGWPDCPQEERFEGTEVVLPGLQPPPQGWEKDRVLLRIVQRELSEGRRVLVYFGQVNKRDPMPRIRRMLAEHGIDARILRQDIDGTKREQWVGRAVEEGCQVLLCNPALLAHGLDLVAFPTIVYFGIPTYSIYAWKQASRRSWRLTQDREVRVIYLYWVGTRQEQALGLVAAKLLAATLIDGDVAEGLAAMKVGEREFLHEMISRAVRGEGWEPPSLPVYPLPVEGCGYTV